MSIYPLSSPARLVVALAFAALAPAAQAAEPIFERMAIFPAESQAQPCLVRGRAAGWQPAGGLVRRQRRT